MTALRQIKQQPGPESHGGHDAHSLFEQLFRRDGEPIGNLGRPVESLQNRIAKRAANDALAPRPGDKLDAAEAGFACGADHIAFSHERTMHLARYRSKTVGRHGKFQGACRVSEFVSPIHPPRSSGGGCAIRAPRGALSALGNPCTCGDQRLAVASLESDLIYL